MQYKDFTMSSVSFNVGFSNERNSSRVLKPPGGGHSDIFGIRELHEQKKPQRNIIDQKVLEKDRDEQKTLEKDHTNTISVETETKTVTEPNNKNEEIEKSTEEEISENKAAEENLVVNEEPKPEPPRRVRVPPGGFSSGLW